MSEQLRITAVDAYRVSIPLREPYHLSKVYGTLTHCDVVLLRVCTASGVEGWGEADPGGLHFTGDTAADVMAAVRNGVAMSMLGSEVDVWVANRHGREHHGSLAAACDVAAHDALARATDRPLWALLGEQLRTSIEIMWPTSSGTAESDLKVIGEHAADGYRTFMLKSGDREIAADLDRVRSVCEMLPEGVRVMVDANQGWNREEAQEFVTGAADLPLFLLEQPLAADDLEGLRQLRETTGIPISVDESLQTPAQARHIIEAGAADVFSIKVSKNGGLCNALDIADRVRAAGKRVLMNSMIELGITQSASLHLGCVLDHLMDCGHAYMSTLRMADDITDFSNGIHDGRAHLGDSPGLGVRVNLDKVHRYLLDEYHV